MSDFEVMPVGTRCAMEEAAEQLRGAATSAEDAYEIECFTKAALKLEAMLVQPGVTVSPMHFGAIPAGAVEWPIKSPV